ncbi:MAG: hypothetical protein M1401_03315 [Chloroflexi bacterium]|nr:hypothetical protein [Chloroflexota bacterium]
MIVEILGQLAAGLAGGALETALQAKRNPAKKKPGQKKASRVKGRENRDLRRAKRLAEKFHGTWQDNVVELSAKDRRKPSRYAVVAGELKDYTYSPRKGKRAEYDWHHDSLDKGFGRGKGKKKPLLVVDPATKKPAIVANRAAVKFDPRRGFMG